MMDEQDTRDALPTNLQTAKDEPDQIARALNNAYVVIEERSDDEGAHDAIANCVLHEILRARAALQARQAPPSVDATEQVKALRDALDLLATLTDRPDRRLEVLQRAEEALVTLEARQAPAAQAEPTRIWIDTEFNEHEGRHELISMALVAEDGREWYEVLPCLAPRPWVAANVMPKLRKEPVSFLRLAESLCEFLRPYKAVHIIGDWPTDIALFCDALIVGPGQRIDTPTLTLEVIRLDGESADPHNALADARGIRDAYLAAHPPAGDAP